MKPPKNKHAAGPVQKKQAIKSPTGGKTKNGQIFGNWTKRRGKK